MPEIFCIHGDEENDCCDECAEEHARRSRTSQTTGSAPVRFCCGERHWGAVCPDGKVMCCICFRRVSQNDLNILANDKKEDVCKACAEMEQND